MRFPFVLGCDCRKLVAHLDVVNAIQLHFPDGLHTDARNFKEMRTLIDDALGSHRPHFPPQNALMTKLWTLSQKIIIFINA